MVSRSKGITAVEALVDHQLSPYWEKALLGLVTAERAREAAAGGSVPWDADVFPWSVIVLAALWDERRPLKPRMIADWGTAVGRRAGMPTLRTTLAQMTQTRVLGGEGGPVLVKDSMKYRLGPDLERYFTARWGKFRPAELRWGLDERAVEDRGGGDLKMATDQQLANMTRTVSSKEAREEIERRRVAGVWSGAVFVETSAGGASVAAPAPAVATRETDEEYKARVNREMDEHIATATAMVALPLMQRPKPPAPFTYPMPRNKRFYDAEEMETFADLTIDQFWALTGTEQRAIKWGYAEVLGEPFNQYDPPTPHKWMTAKMIEAARLSARQPQMTGGTEILSVAVTTVTAESEISMVYSGHEYPDTHSEEPDEMAAEPPEEDGCPNDPDDAPDEMPDDIDVIYPTADELAAIMRGEVVGPAVPEGFEESLDSEDTEA